MIVSKFERLAEFMRRLNVAPAKSTFDDAYDLVCNTINAVEDELTSIPYDPSKWQTDGRMYPPQLDNMSEVPGRDDVTRLRTRYHNILIANNGAIQIWDVRKSELILSKNGADGKGVRGVFASRA
jgi:hypothetical protein